MREYMGLYRGKTKSGKWVEGYYFKAPLTLEATDSLIPIEDGWFFLSGIKRHCIATEDGSVYQVLPETVGQYTGLLDKNGKKIFEGDIVEATYIHNVISRDSTRRETKIYVVTYHDEYCYFYLKRAHNNMLFDGNWNYGMTGIEIIGNIHDNPELLKGGKDG